MMVNSIERVIVTLSAVYDIDCYVAGTTSLQLVNVTVPRYAELNSSVALGCHFDLSGNTLYSVKWYKDDHEFYRYMPSYEPKNLVFPQNGINLDDQRSGMNQVTLRGVNFNSTGAYRCEVSTEGPNFATVVSTEAMTVRGKQSINYF
ncbi:hypothetical protein B566_EDAN000894 [Ephemera danica]|nr:hypothetical protein B566_EDAN000894 [Ephemera danica]